MPVSRAWPRILTPTLGLVLAVGWFVGCADSDTGDGRPRVVVTTAILGDVVSQLVGDQAAVEVIMGPGADPHELQLSAREAADIGDADVLVQNGGDLEEGLLDTLDAVVEDGVPICTALDGVDPLATPGGEVDPHFFTDPDRMADAAEALTDCLVEAVPTLDTTETEIATADYATELRVLADEVDDLLADIATEDRLLVTNHDVLGYFADRYDFAVLGVVVPGGSTQGAASAAELDALADALVDEGVPAVFVDASAPRGVADNLAAEAGAVVVPLYTETLGEADSPASDYEALVRENANRIAEALGG